MANINSRDIENTAKSIFDENFKRQAMNATKIPRDIMLEFIINHIKYWS